MTNKLIILLVCLAYISAENLRFHDGKDKNGNGFTWIAFSKDEFVRRLEVLVWEPSSYRMEYPWNLLYWDGQQWWCDCSNLLKALFNGRDINDKTPGSYQRDLSNTGDVNDEGLMQKCTSRSTNFNALKAGEPRLIRMNGHIGAYLGKDVDVEGRIHNVIECTGAWGGGMFYSYVDNNGGRYNCRGCTNYGQWTEHGLPTQWVSY